MPFRGEYQKSGAVEPWTSDQEVMSSSPGWVKLRNNLRQVVHITSMCLSPISITWYFASGSDALWLGK